MANLKINSVSKSFDDIHALQDINLEVEDGEFFVLLGKTGAGKTTLLRAASGLEDLDGGEIFIDDKLMNDIPPSDRNVTFVFQQYSLYPHMSVYDNLAFPMRSPKINASQDEIEQKVQEVAKLLRIGHKLQNKATALSGGEMQRVAIGRALVRSPLIFFMDEPLSSLDAKLRSELRVELKRIQTELGATILYVTHDQVEALTLADRIGVMREGVLLQVGTPKEIFSSPCNEYVASKLGSPPINLVPTKALNYNKTPAKARTIGLRSEHVQFSNTSSEGSYEAKVKRVEHLGDQSHLHLTLNGFEITFLADPHVAFEDGQTIYLELIDPLYFDHQTEVVNA